MVCIREEGEIKDDPKVFYFMVEGVGDQISEKEWVVWKVKEIINLLHHTPLSFSANPCRWELLKPNTKFSFCGLDPLREEVLNPILSLPELLPFVFFMYHNI